MRTPKMQLQKQLAYSKAIILSSWSVFTHWRCHTVSMIAPLLLQYRKFFIGVPTILNWMFWFFKPLLSPNTFAKMEVVGSSHHGIKKALLHLIDANNLPKRYGGHAEAF
jgi:hypothetical protein